MKFLKQLGLAAVIGLGSFAAKADTVELALLLDSSGSVGSSDWNLQMQAYSNIFGSGTFYDDYVVGGDTLVVSAWGFSNNVFDISGGFFTINNNTDAIAFANTFTEPYAAGYTNTPLAIDTAVSALLNNNVDGDRLIIDISTDGVPCRSGSQGGCGFGSGTWNETISALTDAVAQGVTTNFIGVGSGITISELDALASAGEGFYKVADSFSTFETALGEKLFREINTVPAPASVLFFGVALLGLGMRRMRG